MMLATMTVATEEHAFAAASIAQHVPAVDLREHRFHERLTVCVLGIPPIERTQRFIADIGRPRGLGFEPFGKLVHEPRIASRIAGRRNRLLTPLKRALCLRER